MLMVRNIKAKNKHVESSSDDDITKMITSSSDDDSTFFQNIWPQC